MTRLEALEIYKDRSAKFENTQSIQWKMNLSIWTLLGLAIVAELKFDGNLVWFGVAVILLHAWFCGRIQSSLESDKDLKKKIIKALNKIDEKKTETNFDSITVKLPKESTGIGSRHWQWVFIQTSITTLLVIFLVSFKK